MTIRIGPIVNPEEIRRVQALRDELGRAIERMIELLDELEGDPDLEEQHDAEDDRSDYEPSLGFTTGEAQKGRNAPVMYGLVDLEDEHDGREPDVDDEDGHDLEDDRSDLEPSLGWTHHEAQTGKYAVGWNVNQDLEEEHDGCESEEDASVDDGPCDDERYDCSWPTLGAQESLGKDVPFPHVSSKSAFAPTGIDMREQRPRLFSDPFAGVPVNG